MEFIRRVVQFFAGLNQTNTKSESIQMARAYRPVSPKAMPRWRNLGVSITPYHFMQPVLIPVQGEQQHRRG